MANMFKKAADKAADPKTTKARAKKAGNEIPTPGLQEYAALDTAIKTMETLKETFKGSLHEEMQTRFVATGMVRKGKPENYKAADTDAKGSMQLRKRTSRSALSSVDQDALNELGIPFATEEDIPTTFVINPEHKDNEELLAKVSDALSKVDGIPEDFIQMQVGTPRSFVTDESVDAVFKLDAEPMTILEALQIVTTLAIRPTYTGGVDKALDLIKTLIK